MKFFKTFFFFYISINVFSQNSTISTTNDLLFPSSQINVEVSLDNTINLNNIALLQCSYYINDDTPINQIAKFFIYFNPNAIINRKINFKIGGLLPNKSYKIEFYVQGKTITDDVCRPITALTPITISTLNSIILPKLLFVLDKEFENDIDINQKLAEYQIDVNKLNPSMTFEKYYINPTNVERNMLYEKIMTDYNNTQSPLRYLFFIGDNAGAELKRYILDKQTNSVLYTYTDYGFSYLTQVNNPSYYYNSSLNQFEAIKYLNNTCTSGIINSVGTKTYESYDYDLAFGCIIPTRIEDAKQYILNYFTKLHQYKTGQITFNKKVLSADTFGYDRTVPQAIETANNRWKNNDTINVSYKYPTNYIGSYPDWTTDFLNKLSNNSYEICIYSGHGSPISHTYGISNTTIAALPQLNTMIFDFNSCSVGDYKYRNYLAGVYLEKGNTLFIKAFTTPVFLILNYDKSSTVGNFFLKNRFYSELLKNRYFSDVYRSSEAVPSVQMHFGDPLLTLNIFCNNNLTYTSPDQNFNGNLYPNINTSSGNINASNKITGHMTKVIFESSKSILLTNGFIADKGTNFKAEIKGCINP